MQILKLVTCSLLLFCGTFLTAQQQEDRPLVIEKSDLPCLNKEFNVVVHITKNEGDSLGVEVDSIAAVLTRVNDLFAPICVSFKICETNIINNFQYDTVATFEWEEMQVIYHEARKINIFWVAQFDFEDELCGVADSAGITNLESGGRSGEFVKSSNCETTGDFLCDTPADPFTLEDEPNQFVDEANCRFTNMDRDNEGEWYVPHVGNIMSYYPDVCKCEFTDEQYRVMVNTYLSVTPRAW